MCHAASKHVPEAGMMDGSTPRSSSTDAQLDGRTDMPPSDTGPASMLDASKTDSQVPDSMPPQPQDASMPPASQSDASTPQTDAGKTGCNPTCSQAKPVCEQGVCVECSLGAARCEGDSPMRCSADHHWQVQEPCGGSTPACSNGTCAAVRVVGSIVTQPNPGATTGNIRLVNHGLQRAPATCGDVKGFEVCVSGGLMP